MNKAERQAMSDGMNQGTLMGAALVSPVCAVLCFATDHPVFAAIFGAMGVLGWIGWGRFYNFRWRP